MHRSHKRECHDQTIAPVNSGTSEKRELLCCWLRCSTPYAAYAFLRSSPAPRISSFFRGPKLEKTRAASLLALCQTVCHPCEGRDPALKGSHDRFRRIVMGWAPASAGVTTKQFVHKHTNLTPLLVGASHLILFQRFLNRDNQRCLKSKAWFCSHGHGDGELRFGCESVTETINVLREGVMSA